MTAKRSDPIVDNNTAAFKKDRSEFITSPVDYRRKNALHDRDLRDYLKFSENFKKLVRSGILLSDGRIICSDEQWAQTKEALINKILSTIYGRSKSASPVTKVGRSRTSLGAASSKAEVSPLRRGSGAGRSSSHHLPGRIYETTSQSSDEIWGNMSKNDPGSSKEGAQSRKGSAYSRDGLSKRYSQSVHQTVTGKVVPGKGPSSSGLTSERGQSQQKKSLREHDAINKQRIIDELRRNERKKPGQGKQYQSKEHIKTKIPDGDEKRNEENMNQESTKRATQRDAAILKTLGQSADILNALKSGLGGNVIKAFNEGYYLQPAAAGAESDPLETLLLDLLNRQDRLFRALGERNVAEILGFLDLTPESILVSQKPMYEQYSPHVQMKKMIHDLQSRSVTEEIFYKEAADLVKMMNPAQIVRHIAMCAASAAATRRILKVTSKPVAADRFGLTWSTERPSRDSVASLAVRLVDGAIGQARNVHAYLTAGSQVNLSQLGIGNPDPLVAVPRHISVGVLTIEPYSDEHVSFSDKSTVLRRPLEGGLAVADLKPVLDRPPTPIPDAERVQRKSRERLERIEAESAIIEAKKKARELVKEIRKDSEKRLRRRLKQEGVKHERKLLEDIKRVMLSENSSERLKDRVYTRLADWKAIESERNQHLARVVESISDLVPHVVGAQKDRFIRSISRQMSSIVAMTLKQAQELMQEAIKTTNSQTGPEKMSADEDSDEFESVSSAMLDETLPDDQLEGTEGEQDTFRPRFGDDELHLSQTVAAGGLAAISVKHSEDGGGHKGHSHAPPVSHMKQFFKNRASMPAISTTAESSGAARSQRHSMPAALPECMDPGQLHGRHSFLSVTQPDVKVLPEYRHKTQRQVESVLHEHSAFGRLQQLCASPAGSDDGSVLVSEDLGQPDEELVPTARRRRQPLPAAGEEDDALSELPPTDEDHGRRGAPRTVASVPTALRAPAAAPSAATGKTQSLTSRVMLRCDSDPRLSLRTSTAEVHVDVHEHSAQCDQHQSHHEEAAELQVLESSAFGISAERTVSESGAVGAGPAAAADARRSGSADGGPLTHSDIDSDDEAELRVRHPSGDNLPRTGAPSRYY
ncbi:uncharacterized protein LOC122390366 [Amphibalanus amphitrite]|uniref:uncharacterized protein LOC122390366 n=1 Tax=Amphibalanus amphitrite TaxID=1232801 RepID=UPI001C926118|nr:uncharacterized protein LOC122390366 [Amphibalanus amphitrite]